jgi:hypothetical protein
MEKAPPPDPTCPTCKKTAQFARPINAVVEFWECEDHHMFVVDKKPPPKGSVAKPTADAEAVAPEPKAG